MNNQIFILQLNPSDYEDLLSLAQLAEVADRILEPGTPSRWTRIAADLTHQVERQKNGRFFQCAACHEDTSIKKLSL
jgi:hypothetical protein